MTHIHRDIQNSSDSQSSDFFFLPSLNLVCQLSNQKQHNVNNSIYIPVVTEKFTVLYTTVSNTGFFQDVSRRNKVSQVSHTLNTSTKLLERKIFTLHTPLTFL